MSNIMKSPPEYSASPVPGSIQEEGRLFPGALPQFLPPTNKGQVGTEIAPEPLPQAQRSLRKRYVKHLNT
jgi:hypothetical protein